MLCRKVKTILVIMGICCFPMISWAQVFLSGRIVDKKTNEPVVGASVYIRKNQVGDNANDNGLYRIKLPQNGTYLVEVSFIGYKTIKQSVTRKKTPVLLDQKLLFIVLFMALLVICNFLNYTKII